MGACIPYRRPKIAIQSNNCPTACCTATLKTLLESKQSLISLRFICSQAVFEQLAAFTASLCFERAAVLGWQEVRRRWHRADTRPLRRGAL